jgi:hypothetical protein
MAPYVQIVIAESNFEKGSAMRAALRTQDNRKIWTKPTLFSFKLTDEELTRVKNATVPGEELEKIYRARFR